MIPRPESARAAVSLDAANPNRARCRLYDGMDAGPEDRRCWLIPGHGGSCMDQIDAETEAMTDEEVRAELLMAGINPDPTPEIEDAIRQAVDRVRRRDALRRLVDSMALKPDDPESEEPKELYVVIGEPTGDLTTLLRYAIERDHSNTMTLGHHESMECRYAIEHDNRIDIMTLSRQEANEYRTAGLDIHELPPEMYVPDMAFNMPKLTTEQINRLLSTCPAGPHGDPPPRQRTGPIPARVTARPKKKAARKRQKMARKANRSKP